MHSLAVGATAQNESCLCTRVAHGQRRVFHSVLLTIIDRHEQEHRMYKTQATQVTRDSDEEQQDDSTRTGSFCRAIALLVAGAAVAGALSGCLVEPGRGGYYHDGYDHRYWQR